ncbi:glycoside hydrolase [Syncephalis fuscata]|nr:glycoside hydrolase [Syncephalis fuscata]
MKLYQLARFVLPLVLASIASVTLNSSLAAPNGNNTAGNTPQPSAAKRAVVAYYADWTTGVLPPESIPFKKITHINYSFAVLKENNEPYFETEWILPRVVRSAHAENVKVLLSIGGWTGSRWFSPMSATAQGRNTFITKTLSIVDQFSLDGVDIDWEYPGRLGMMCNVYNVNTDADNFYTLLNELRAALDTKYGRGNKEITLAVRVQPFDVTGGPLKDVKRYGASLDRINIMAYDINGSWSTTTGPNAPFNYDTPGKGDPFSVVQSIKAWTDAGFPREKITLGLGFYGRSARATVDMTQGNVTQYAPFDKTTIPRGDQNDAPWGDPCPGAPWGYSGVWQWRNLRAQGVLTTPETAGAPWVRYWDNVSKTPWLFNTNDKTFISYDDRRSLAIKTDYARCQGLGGVMVWALHQDNGELLDSVQSIHSQTRCNGYIDDV